MKREDRIKKIHRAKMFTQSQVVLLTGLTRKQLVRWDISGIVKPYRHPCLLYDWNQVLFLRILFYWRKEASFQKIERILLDEPVERFYDHMAKSSLAMLNDQKLVFINDSFHKEQTLFSQIAKSLETIDIEEIDYSEMIPGVVLLNIRAIVHNLKKAGEELNIENFALKVDEKFQTDDYRLKVGETFQTNDNHLKVS